MNPELNPERPVAEIQHQPGIFEKINNAARTRLAIAGIALASAVGGAELSRSSEADASSSVPEATASSLKDTCVQAGLAKPVVKNAIITHAGKYQYQSNIYTADYPEMPSQCEGKYKRAGVGMFQAKAPGDEEWRSLRGYWTALQGINSKRFNAGFEESPDSHGKRSDEFYLRGNERARILTRIRILNKNGKQIAQRQRVTKAEISRKKGLIPIEW